MESNYLYFKTLSLMNYSTCIDWSPDIAYYDERELSYQRAVFSFYSTRRIVIQSFSSSEKKPTDPQQEDNKTSVSTCNPEISSIIDIPEPAPKVKFMPHDPRNVVALSTTGEVTMYTLQEERLTCEAAQRYIRRTLHTGGNFAGTMLSFHPTEKLAMITGASDGITRLHDMQQAAVARIFACYPHIPLDASWNRGEMYLFGTIGSDNHFNIWDTRQSNPCFSVLSHATSANTIDFSHQRFHLFLTGGYCGIAIWDIRFLSRPLNRLQDNAHAVLTTKWSPYEHRVFASCGDFGETFLGNFLDTGDLRTIFKHKLHKAQVDDIRWHPRWNMLTSVDRCGEVHFWQPKF